MGGLPEPPSPPRSRMSKKIPVWIGLRVLSKNRYFVFQVVTGKFYDAVLALASALHLMILDGYDVRGRQLGFDFDKGPVIPWRNGEELMKYIKKARNTFPYVSSLI